MHIIFYIYVNVFQSPSVNDNDESWGEIWGPIQNIVVYDCDKQLRINNN